MADTSAEGTSYSALERFLIWFVIPFVFTAVLLFVLLSIFDYDIKSSIQNALHNTPVIGKVVPAPKEKASAADTDKSKGAEESAKSKDEEITKLNARITELETALQQSDATTQQKDQSLKDAEAKAADLEEKLKDKTQTEEEYKNKITELANLYASMSPSKAAPIMQNLTPKEMVLVFSMMKSDSRGAILEKMDPKVAAEASIGLKDVVPVKDQEIAALQERLKINGSSDTTQASTSVSKADLGQTFGNMTPKSASNVLLEMYKSSPEKVITILSGMDNTSRSKVMSALSDANKEVAAAITSKLAQ
ncbi:MotE family protein [Paenibacillus hexagrammi]|uniref:MotE family protein n=1 Tax=Paenibacillus hexagrammi TaxID=2908839 RepID=A0ABY3SP88_9BACL|nr:MotE family protein [Paenibacillus sp. YPD9-1]UJF35345.1 MotE family protein [Paenibacillus sp. YPD9-1]